MNGVTMPRAPKMKINSYQKDKIIHKLALEEPQRSIAKDHNITQSAVSGINTANELKIKEIKQELMDDNIDSIKEGIKIDVENNTDLSISFKKHENITPAKVAYKASVQKNVIRPILEDAGIFKPNTMLGGDDYSQHITISASYQEFIDFQNKNKISNADNTQAIDTEGDTIDDDK